MELVFDVAEIDDGTGGTRDWGVTQLPANTIPVSVVDPTVFEGAAFTWALGVSIVSELQDFTIDWNCNPILIKNYTSKSHILQAQGKIEVKFSGSAYGDETSMGTSALLNDLLADSTGNITVNVDGTNSIVLVAGSYDKIDYPIKEADLIVMDFEGTANNATI